MRRIRANLPVQQQKFIIKRLCFSVVGLTLFPVNAEAQITPDSTLSTIVEQSENMKKITGGERVGNNLFHSFKEFSILEDIEAIFENGLDVENIFTRITGNDISVIDGLLKTAGGANFFLINPNGIVFGKNAVLDIGGSFIATTANNIDFADGKNFAVREDNPNVSLTISVPVGLGFFGNNGSITVNGSGSQVTNASRLSPIEFGERPTGISVPSGQTLALVGNGLDLNGGVITTQGGQIYLSSIDSGSVSIDRAESGLTLLDDNVTKYQDINLNQQSLIDSSGEREGIIFLNGKNISFSNSSFVLAQNQGNLAGGSINIKASESLSLADRVSDISSNIRSETFSTGEGADINISAKKLLLQDSARIRTSSFSYANGGDITIDVSDSIQLFTSSIIATTFTEGKGGNISLSTSDLRLNNGGITSSTFGEGNGGLLNINADLIEVAGGNATDRANIATTSFASGNVGNVTLNTTRLRVIDGASLSSSSFASGNAGNLTINASESIEVSGRNNNSITSSNPQSIIRSAIQSATPQGGELGLPEVPSGNGGNLVIDTPLLKVSQEGIISVENQGSGNAGTLTITADNLNLETTGSITAATASGTGGNITLNTQNLEIGAGSEITATAENDGDGGNITINTTNLIAKKNAQVTANAFRGRGGNISITSQGLFLFDSPENIFTASSKLGIDGEVNINTTIDFLNSFDSISLEFILAEEALIGSCFTRGNSKQGSFVYRGTGGLPVSPSSAIDEEQSLSSQLPEVQPNSPTSHTPADSDDISSSAKIVIYPAQTARKWQVGEPIIEPTNLIKTADGRLLWVRKQVDNASSLICQ